MRRVHRNAREARTKCIDCNKPVVRTVDGAFVCIQCGGSPIDVREGDVADVAVVHGGPAAMDDGEASLPARDND